MTLIHISETKNRESIRRNGLLPSIIKMDTHLHTFQKLGIIKGNKALYTWVDSDKNEKFIRDMVYCKVWIHPRNDLFHSHFDKFNDYVDFRKISNTPYIKHEMLFDVYVIEVPDIIRIKTLLHGQWSMDDPNASCFQMDDFYAHDDKELYISERPLKGRIVGSTHYCFNEGKIEIDID